MVAVTVSWPAVDVVAGQPLDYTMDDVSVETVFGLGYRGGCGNGESSYQINALLVGSLVEVGTLLMLLLSSLSCYTLVRGWMLPMYL